MKTKINTKIKFGLKAACVLAVGAAILIPTGESYAWGPKRQTYTNENPSDHVQFNSITNNTVITDERNFVRVAEENGDGKYNWVNTLEIEPGKKYAVMIYYHNNAASNLNGNGGGMALNARVSAKYPSTVSSSNKGEVYAQISADNAVNYGIADGDSKNTVWDEAYFTTKSKADVVLHYISGSAKLYNHGEANGTMLDSSSLFSSKGHLLGYNKLIGNLPGCSEYSGQVVFTLQATQVGATVSKAASLDGINFVKNITAKPGDTVTYKVTFKNSGTEDLTNVGFHDVLPEGVTLVPGTTKLINGQNPNGVTMVDLIGKNGFATGMYTPNSTATLTYQVKINDDIVANSSCGAHEYTNHIFVNHDAGEVSDTSTVTVNKECTEEETTTLVPQEECKADENGVLPDGCDEETPSELPKTGPAEIMLAVIAIVCIATGIAYWYHSQQEVAKMTKKVTGKDKKS